VTEEDLMQRDVVVVYGTRPEAIKLAPLVRALRSDPSLRPVVVVTGQHREMLDQVNSLFGIQPDIDLDVMSHGASVSAITRTVLERLERVLDDLSPEAVVVQGDTTSAFSASYASFLAGCPVVHLEAGLRTGDLRSPFPEEANRRLTTVLADLNLAPTPAARDNLRAEGVSPGKILVTGNTVIDALQWVVTQPTGFTDPRLSRLRPDRDLVLVTAHRRESWGAQLEDAMRGLRDVALARPDVDLVLPMHRNPVVRASAGPLADLPNVLLTEPLPYAEFAHLLARARVVVTDSGGVQEEAPGLGTPVLVMRDRTERPEGVAAGVARLIGTRSDVVADEVGRLLDDPAAHAAMAQAVNPYGDGSAARRSLGAIRALLGLGAMPPAYAPGPQQPTAGAASSAGTG
jgi:UDP-N-acetylglucosamine 2-epimerase (non-hydrolysing)